ncbi:hypothetical protein IMCC26134_04355 [Verrucomicrobia bacterium IMCC26134]|nr:hypothetical protein IMCC26134_04355 [Verrucomicrobia bacterium IMCC26134]
MPSPSTPRPKLLGQCLVMAFLVATLTSCTSPGRGSSAKPESKTTFSELKLKELDEATCSFADRYVTLISDACDQAEKLAATPTARTQALRLKLHHASSAYAIATGPSPLGQLLDLCSVVTLSKMNLADEGRANLVFGPLGGPVVARAFTQAHDDIWRMASDYLNPAEIEAVQAVIVEWRRQNPDVAMMAYVRFDDFAKARAGLQQVRPQIGGLFSQISEANRKLENAQTFAQRTFFYAQRVPRLMQWQAERTVDAILQGSDVQRVIGQSDAFTRAMSDVAAEVKKIDQRQTELSALLTQVDGIVRELKGFGPEIRDTVQTVAALNEPVRQNLVIVDRILARQAEQPHDPNAKPLDLVEVRGLVKDATAALAELQPILKETEALTAPGFIDARLQKFHEAAEQRVDHIFYRSAELIGLAFLAGLTLLWYRARLR